LGGGEGEEDRCGEECGELHFWVFDS
jgi:hypothetical protein